MKESYTPTELDQVLSRVQKRSGWDFSRMNDSRVPVPWDYHDVVLRYLTHQATVLDVGTGGGESFLQLADFFDAGLGVDIDPEMIERARANGRNTANVAFAISSETLDEVLGSFDVILNRHAPFNLTAIHDHLKTGGYYVTQQVAESSMRNIKEVVGQVGRSPISEELVNASPLKLIAFMKYDVEYLVRDIDSLVFWLQALDGLHSDLEGAAAISQVDALNSVLANNVDQRGFITNEARYLVIAQRRDVGLEQTWSLAASRSHEESRY